MLWRDLRSDAVGSIGGAADAGGAAGGAVLGLKSPAFAREASRSAGLFAFGAFVWFCTVFSWECVASRRLGTAARICGVLGLGTLANKACSPFSAFGGRPGGMPGGG